MSLPRQIQPGDPFHLGVNYWPRRKAMGWWKDFDAAEVRDEFDLIASLGLQLVRIFLLWEDWQPSPDRVSGAALGHLETVCDLAEERGLLLDVTFFVGHMSGPSWVPDWMLERSSPLPPRVNQVVNRGVAVDCGYANLFRDPQALQAAETLIETVVGAFQDHPGIGLWNLGNEPDLFAWPENPTQGRGWVRRMAGLVRNLDATHPVTLGLHVHSLIEDNGLRVDEVFAEVDLAVMHGYPMYQAWAEGPLDPDFVPFLCALTTAMCGKPTLAEEFGGPTAPPGKRSSIWSWRAYGRPRQQFMASETDFAQYLQEVLPRLVTTGATGAMLWCFADYAPELYDRPPCDQARHERFFGLVRSDGSMKPHAAVVQAFAATRPQVQLPQHPIALVISPAAYYQDPLAHARRLYIKFRNDLPIPADYS